MVIIFLSIILIIVLFYFGKYKKRWDVGNKLPGPKGVPIIGYAKLFNISPKDLLTHIMELREKYNKVIRMWIGNECWVVIYDPNLVEKIVNNQQVFKSSDYDFLRCWLGGGLLTSEGKKWFGRRKAITPAFHFKILDEFMDVFIKQTDVMLKKFDTNEPVNVYPLILRCALDIICETSMGKQLNAQNNLDSEYAKAVHQVSEVVYRRTLNPFLASDLIFRFSKDYNIQKKALEVINSTTRDVITERRLSLTTSENLKTNDDNDDNDYGIRKKMALLDILLKTTIDGKQLSDEDIEEEVNTFMFAGHDTTSSTSGFLFYNIAKYPDVQEKLYNEINDIIGYDGEITMSNLNKLKYLDLVLKESMRLHTTVPFIGRQIHDEWKIDDDITLPENSRASICVYAMCHNKDVFPNPEKFIPERFDITSKAEKMNPYSYIPFSAGHRNCIGQKFAIFEMKTIIVKTLQKFEISLANPEEELTLVVEMVLKSENGINIKFKKRIV